MNKLLTLVGMLLASLSIGCDAGSEVSRTTLASILPENKASATYAVEGMT